MQARYGGVPNVRAWIGEHRPPLWDAAWDKFLPADVDGESIIVNRLLLGDRRTDDPGAPPPPPPPPPPPHPAPPPRERGEV